LVSFITNRCKTRITDTIVGILFGYGMSPISLFFMFLLKLCLCFYDKFNWYIIDFFPQFMNSLKKIFFSRALCRFLLLLLSFLILKKNILFIYIWLQYWFLNKYELFSISDDHLIIKFLEYIKTGENKIQQSLLEN